MRLSEPARQRCERGNKWIRAGRGEGSQGDEKGVKGGMEEGKGRVMTDMRRIKVQLGANVSSFSAPQ